MSALSVKVDFCRLYTPKNSPAKRAISAAWHLGAADELGNRFENRFPRRTAARPGEAPQYIDNIYILHNPQGNGTVEITFAA
jgi:hypothetical protein